MVTASCCLEAALMHTESRWVLVLRMSGFGELEEDRADGQGGERDEDADEGHGSAPPWWSRMGALPGQRQLRPDRLPVVRAQVPSTYQTASELLDANALLGRYRPPTCLLRAKPLIDRDGRHAQGCSKGTLTTHVLDSAADGRGGSGGHSLHSKALLDFGKALTCLA
jgi:hypothetical protein